MQKLSRSIEIHAPIDKVFHFHDDIENLLKITPPDAHLTILSADPPGKDQRVVLSLSQFGIITLRWEVEITEYNPPNRMTDEQLHGPFHSWKQNRNFEKLGGTLTRMTDTVEYELPFHTISDLILGAFFKAEIEQMFDTARPAPKPFWKRPKLLRKTPYHLFSNAPFRCLHGKRVSPILKILKFKFAIRPYVIFKENPA